MTPGAVLRRGRRPDRISRNSLWHNGSASGIPDALSRAPAVAAGVHTPIPESLPMRSIVPTRRGLAAALVLACAAIAAPPAHAQLAIEARGGIATPRDAFTNDVDADGGYATEVSLTVGTLPFVSLYGAWQQVKFDRDDSEESVVTDQGWAGGVRVSVPTPFIPIDPWIRAGVVAHELEAGGLHGGGDSGVGVEVAGGLRVQVGSRIALTPGVSWTRYGFDDETVTDGKVNVEYLRVDVGVRFGF